MDQRPTLRVFAVVAYLLASACANEAPPEEEWSALDEVPLDGSFDTFFRPTKHGRITLGEPVEAVVGEDARFHEWSFELESRGWLELQVTPDHPGTAVAYLYRRRDGAWGRYAARSDRQGALSYRVGEGAYRLIVSTRAPATHIEVTSTCGPTLDAPGDCRQRSGQLAVDALAAAFTEQSGGALFVGDEGESTPEFIVGEAPAGSLTRAALITAFSAQLAARYSFYDGGEQPREARADEIDIRVYDETDAAEFIDSLQSTEDLEPEDDIFLESVAAFARVRVLFKDNLNDIVVARAGLVDEENGETEYFLVVGRTVDGKIAGMLLENARS